MNGDTPRDWREMQPLGIVVVNLPDEGPIITGTFYLSSYSQPP